MINDPAPASPSPSVKGHQKISPNPALPNLIMHLLNAIGQVMDAESMQHLIQQHFMMAAATDILRGIGVRSAHQVRPKMLLSAMLISKFPESLFGRDPSPDEQNLIIMARVMYECLSGHCERQVTANECLKAFLTYKSTFEAWQESDRPALIDSLIARYIDLAEALSSLATRRPSAPPQSPRSPTAHADSLQQNILGMQQQIREKLERVGGAKAMSRLEEAMFRRDPVKAVHTEMPSIPVAALVHELCFNRHFELIRLLEEYNGAPPEPNVVIEGSEDVFKFMQYLQQDLLPIIPTGTCMELQQHLEPQAVLDAIRSGQFDLRNALKITIDVMAQSCAPIRDDEIAMLRTLQRSPDTNALISRMVRVIDLMRLDFYAFALISQRPVLLDSIVEYEQRYFASIQFVHASRFAQEHPDWTEWVFLEQFESIESVEFDRRRLCEWRHALHAILYETAYEILARHHPMIHPASINDNNSVVILLRKRIQGAIKESIGTVTRDGLRRDGFSIKNSVILSDMLQDIQHFMRLHMAIHQSRYGNSQ